MIQQELEHKVMIYLNEDFTRFGYKPSKFDFKTGTKLLNKESGKKMVVLQVVDLGPNAFICLKNYFGDLKNVRMSAQEKACKLAGFAKELSGKNGEYFAKCKILAIEQSESRKIERMASYL